MASSHAARLRIIALPLAKPHAPKNLPSLTYYHFQQSTDKPSVPISSSTGKFQRLPDENIARASLRWVTDKASSTWADWGKAKGGWKLGLFRWGEKLIDRIDFEELALKGVDPSLGPTIRHPIRGNNPDAAQPKQISLLYPPSVLSPSSTLGQLSSMLALRKPKHLRGVYLWVGISPFTLPFAIIPIIPNIPFFFCVWRAWSHYRAYRASGYLETLLKNNLLVPQESKVLDEIYAHNHHHHHNDKEGKSEKKEGNSTAGLLIDEKAVSRVVHSFQLPSHAESDMLRAIAQAKLRRTAS